MRKLNAGMIGCGLFARGLYVPLQKAGQNFQIRAAMDINEQQAKEFAEETGASYWTTDVDKMLSDPEIDLVFITTRHDSHASLSVKAANAGKHVLCEKPMGLSREECRAISEAVTANNVKYTVGYNRGLAPLVTKARDLLSCMKEKKMIYHRIQADFSEDHWIHIPEVGGGRIVGEGCHIFDLICELIDQPPVSVYASGGIYLDPGIIRIPDSAVVTITFADGSVGTTLINSVGCPDFPKEVTEIYCNRKAIYIDNFMKMEYYGFEGHTKTTIEVDSMDKGHEIEIRMFIDSILNNTDSPKGIVEAARAAVISYMVTESIKTGGPISISESDYNFTSKKR